MEALLSQVGERREMCVCVFRPRIRSDWSGTVRAVDNIGGVIFLLVGVGGGLVLAIRLVCSSCFFSYRISHTCSWY